MTSLIFPIKERTNLLACKHSKGIENGIDAVEYQQAAVDITGIIKALPNEEVPTSIGKTDCPANQLRREDVKYRVLNQYNKE